MKVCMTPVALVLERLLESVVVDHLVLRVLFRHLVCLVKDRFSFFSNFYGFEVLFFLKLVYFWILEILFF